MSATLFALGATSVLLSNLAARLPEHLAIGPTLLLDQQRNFCPGVALALAQW